MASILNEIGSFQFENLVLNRIPFVFINLTASLPLMFKQPYYQRHLESLELRTTEDEVLQKLKERNHPSHEAILVCCDNGQQSVKLVDSLEASGFLNVFFIKEGLNSLQKF